jgi:nitroimidazol reductase NimA-like FMN-containing flavoprotein (pyridoxamine 5'-phosphate oxidase superfamily)
MDLDRNGLVILDREECYRLLDGQALGRIAIMSGTLPAIVPVNFLRDGDRILVRTVAGTKLEAALRGSVVAFEVDGIDVTSHSGWSVMVTGAADVITDTEDLAAVQRLPHPHWAPRAGDHVVALTTELVSGRRILYGGRLPRSQGAHGVGAVVDIPAGTANR